MLLKPPSCAGCPLHTRGVGWVPPSGISDGSTPSLVFLGESPGVREAERAYPFAGPAGGELHRLFYRLGIFRDNVGVGNCIQCRPPNDKLEKTPWADAVDHCRPNVEEFLAHEPAVIVALGGVPTRELLRTGGNLKDFHGTVTKITLPSGSPAFVVPTFHPAHLVRGAHNLTATVLFDIQRALDVAKEGWEPDVPTLYLDPPPAFVKRWVDDHIAAVQQDPLNVWLSIDIETADKERKLDESELKNADRSMEITRVNVCNRLDEGLTFPFVGPYIEFVGRLLACLGPKCFWNKHYDLKRLWAIYGTDNVRGALLDGMDAWHALHSDVPKGLGFVSPFYSKLGAWKHLSSSRPAYYGGCDGVQNHRSMFGVAQDLHEQGMWDVFWTHMHEVDRVALTPSCHVGLKLDPEKLEDMRADLAEKSIGFYNGMQDVVPEDLKPLHPRQGKKLGWVKRPEGDTFEWPEEGAFNRRPREILEIQVAAEVQVCQTCGAVGIGKKHRCKDPETGKPVKGDNPAVVVKETRQVPRYVIREDFNPGSWQQVLAYIKWCGHKPGREKGKETTNRATIERLAEGRPKSRVDETRRELYRQIMDFREVKKILGTYVEGMQRRLAESTDGRVHPTVTSNPSTLRTAYNSPNLQNVVADKKGGKSLASGFRKCVVAEGEA